MNKLELSDSLKILSDIDKQVLELESEKLNTMMFMAKRAPFKKGHIVKSNGAAFKGRLIKVDRIEFVELNDSYAFIGHGKVLRLRGVTERRACYVVHCNNLGELSEEGVDV